MNIVKPLIISCSRRTDIPAFLMPWIIERIKDGYVDVVNPFNKNQVSRVLFQNTLCWVWWSKNFDSWIKEYRNNKSLFQSFKGHFFQFTINSPSEMENNIRISLAKRFGQLEWLINEFSLLSVNYRFDPIIVYMKKDSEQINSNLTKFEYIMKKISSLGLKEMTFSFATLYPKVKKRMNSRGYIPIELSFKKKKEILDKLMLICNSYGIEMKACCQPDLLKIKGINQANCIDAYKIEQLVDEVIPKIRDKGQRNSCGCFKSKDIGGYTGIFRCKHNCDYCYASPAIN